MSSKGNATSSLGKLQFILIVSDITTPEMPRACFPCSVMVYHHEESTCISSVNTFYLLENYVYLPFAGI